MAKTLLIGIWGLVGYLAVQGHPELSVLVLCGLYVLHLRTYPNKQCPAKCRGGHHYSGFLKGTSYRCGTCNGTSRVPRVGSKLVAPRNRR